jgi:hypothetical protein
VSGETEPGAAPSGRRRARKASRPKARPDRLLSGYLERRPEADPRVLVPRSVLPVARGVLLAEGVVRQGWSVAWLLAFLFAEIFLVVRLTALGDRVSGGPPLDPKARQIGSLPRDVLWLAVALAATWAAGIALERGSHAAADFATGEAWWSRPGWSVLAYVVLLLAGFARDVVEARRSGGGFVSAAAVSAAFLIVALILAVFPLVPLLAFSATLSDEGPRLAIAGLLVLVRVAAELAVLWLPVWGPGQLGLRPRETRRGPEPAPDGSTPADPALSVPPRNG